MLLQVDPRTLGENLHLLIGLLLLLGIAAFVAVAISTGLTAWVGHRREERSWQEIEWAQYRLGYRTLLGKI